MIFLANICIESRYILLIIHYNVVHTAVTVIQLFSQRSGSWRYHCTSNIVIGEYPKSRNYLGAAPPKKQEIINTIKQTLNKKGLEQTERFGIEENDSGPESPIKKARIEDYREMVNSKIKESRDFVIKPTVSKPEEIESKLKLEIAAFINGNRKRGPLLDEAFTILQAIKPSSTESERVFSSSDETLDAIVYLKYYLKSL